MAGEAAVVVALVTITKKQWRTKLILDGKEVKNITPYLDNAETIGNPNPLKSNEGKSFQGSIVLGKGFVLEPDEANSLLAKDDNNKNVVFPYLNGEDLNNNTDQNPSRWVINFFDWDESEAKKYTDCFEIVKRLVKPERDKLLNGNTTAIDRGKKWWRYGRPTTTMYKAISKLQRVLVIAQVSKTVAFAFTTTNKVLDAKLNVFVYDNYIAFALLQNTFHVSWAWKYSTTMKSDLSYAPSLVFETFPFPTNLNPEQEHGLEVIGEAYHEHRRHFMAAIQLGLTKTYNAFHTPEIKSGITTSALQDLDKKAIEKSYSKEVWNFWSHLQKTEGTCNVEEAVAGIVKLRELHVQMDNAVLETYGWNDIQLRHDFYEVDYLPENDRTRFTIHPDARKEILKRLLESNHKIHAQEVTIAEATKIISKKVKTPSKSKASHLQSLLPMRPETAYAAIYSVQDIVRITRLSPQTVKSWFNRLYAQGYEGISKQSNSEGQSLLVNFYGVHEMIVMYDLRFVNKISLSEILDARKWLKERFGKHDSNFYPFTSQKVLDTVSKAGKQIIFTDQTTGDYITLGKGNAQLNLDFIKEMLKRIVFDRDMVSRLYLSDARLTAIDPNLAGGRPCTVEKEILIDSIKSVYKHSNSISYIAKAYEISEEAVQEALNFDRASALN